MSEPADCEAQLAKVNTLEWFAERNQQISTSVIVLHITTATISVPGNGKNDFLIKNQHEKKHLSACKT